MAVTDQTKVFLAFQGGGARGISHVGGLFAVRALEMNIRGVAGTSAGAILAALAAAGYQPEELFDTEAGTHILQSISAGKYTDPTLLFTRKGWRSISVLRDLAKGGAVCRVWFQARGRLVRSAILAITLASLLGLFWKAPLWAHLSLVAILVMVLVGCRWILRGLAPLSAIRDLMDEAIASRLQLPREVTFTQMADAGGLPLKLVATNVTTQSVQLFSRETTPDVVVADAVTASICLPLIFKPCQFNVHDGEAVTANRYLDGGLLSNLPLWPFDEERDLDREVVTVAFGLRAASAAPEQPTHWLPAVVNAIVSGPAQIHMRGIRHLVQIALPTHLQLLDFDAGFEAFSGEIEAAYQTAVQALDEQVENPRAVKEALHEIREALVEALSNTQWPEEVAEPAGAGRLRLRLSLIIQKKSSTQSLQIAFEDEHQHSLRGHALSLRDSAPGVAWRERLAHTTGRPVSFPANLSPERIYPDTAWMTMVPIPFDHAAGAEQADSHRAIILLVDGATALPNHFQQSSAALRLLSETIYVNALHFAEVYDLGRMARSTELWL